MYTLILEDSHNTQKNKISFVESIVDSKTFKDFCIADFLTQKQCEFIIEVNNENISTDNISVEFLDYHEILYKLKNYVLKKYEMQFNSSPASSLQENLFRREGLADDISRILLRNEIFYNAKDTEIEREYIEHVDYNGFSISNRTTNYSGIDYMIISYMRIVFKKVCKDKPKLKEYYWEASNYFGLHYLNEFEYAKISIKKFDVADIEDIKTMLPFLKSIKISLSAQDCIYKLPDTGIQLISNYNYDLFRKFQTPTVAAILTSPEDIDSSKHCVDKIKELFKMCPFMCPHIISISSSESIENTLSSVEIGELCNFYKSEEYDSGINSESKEEQDSKIINSLINIIKNNYIQLSIPQNLGDIFNLNNVNYTKISLNTSIITELVDSNSYKCHRLCSFLFDIILSNHITDRINISYNSSNREFDMNRSDLKELKEHPYDEDSLYLCKILYDKLNGVYNNIFFHDIISNARYYEYSSVLVNYKCPNSLVSFLKYVNRNFLIKEFKYIVVEPCSEDSDGNIIYHPYNMGHKIFKIKQEELKFNKYVDNEYSDYYDELFNRDKLPVEFFDLSNLKKNSEELWNHFKDSYTKTIKEVYDNLMSLN